MSLFSKIKSAVSSLKNRIFRKTTNDDITVVKGRIDKDVIIDKKSGITLNKNENLRDIEREKQQRRQQLFESKMSARRHENPLTGKLENEAKDKYFWQATQQAWRGANTPEERILMIEQFYSKNIEEVEKAVFENIDELEYEALMKRDYETLRQLGWSDSEIKRAQMLDAKGEIYKILSELYGLSILK